MTRYYDPEVGRFLSADVYLSTGQGVLGNNRFAYCNNDPILFYDSDGTSPITPILNLIDFSAIHKMVQVSILKELGGTAKMEVYVKADSGRIGFLDVYDLSNNWYYEVKSEKASGRKSTRDQMARYESSKVVSTGKSPKPGQAKLSGSFSYGLWDVEYSSSSKKNGLVVYTPTYNWKKAASVGSGIAVAVGAALIVYYTGGLIEYKGFSTSPGSLMPPISYTA